MSVQSQTPYNSYTANGVTTVFPYTFLLLDTDDLSVTVDGVVQTITTDYTVSGVGNPSGGNVTFLVAPTNGAAVLVSRLLTMERPTDYQDNGDLFAETINNDLDRLWLAAQQFEQNDIRSIKLPFDTSTDQTLTQTAAARANKGLKFDVSGNITLTVADPDTSEAAAAASASAAAASAASASASAASASASASAASASASAAAAAVTSMTNGTMAANVASITSSGSSILGDAEATDTHAIKGATTLAVNSASAALTITQSGAGDALVLVGSAGEVARVAAGGTATFGGTSVAPALSVIPVASQNRWVTITGSNSSLPTIDTSNGGLHLNSAGVTGIELSSGSVALGGVAANRSMNVQAVASAVNYVNIAGTVAAGGDPSITGTGSDTNVGLRLITKGTGGFRFITASTVDQVRIQDTASANRYLTLTGSNGGNPAIGASAGTVALTAGALSTSATNGLGYGTGAGGTVTQSTSKATGVTLSKPTGEITLHNAALAAATIVSFTLTNTTIAAGDQVLVQHVSGGTVGAYTCTATAAAGSATVYVRNATAGSLSEAIVLKVSVFKAATT